MGLSEPNPSMSDIDASDAGGDGDDSIVDAGDAVVADAIDGNGALEGSPSSSSASVISSVANVLIECVLLSDEVTGVVGVNGESDLGLLSSSSLLSSSLSAEENLYPHHPQIEESDALEQPCPLYHVCVADPNSFLGGHCIPYTSNPYADSNPIDIHNIHDMDIDIDLDAHTDIDQNILLQQTTTLSRSLQNSNPFCNGPPSSNSNPCSKGLWDEPACKCICIPPYCPDDFGSCTTTWWCNPTGENPWKDCKAGVDCPWWKNGGRDESCYTGSQVPKDTWDVFPSRDLCCEFHFPYSEMCKENPDFPTGGSSGGGGASSNGGGGAPTKYPTISKPPEDEFEIVPIKFSARNLPDDVEVRQLKVEMKEILTRILADLSERVEDLRITKIEEFVPENRRNRKGIRRLVTLLQHQEKKEQAQVQQLVHRPQQRILKDLDLYYNVYVVRQNGKKFGPIIIQEIQDNYDQIVSGIEEYTDMTYLSESGSGGGGYEFNWCTNGNGGGGGTSSGSFTMCSKTTAPVLMPTPPPMTAPTDVNIGALSAPAPAENNSADGGGGGMPVWGIILLVMVCCSLIGCSAFLFLMYKRRDEKEEEGYYEEEEVRDMYYDGGGRRGGGGGGGGGGGSSRGGNSHKSRRALGYGGEEGEEDGDGESYSRSSYSHSHSHSESHGSHSRTTDRRGGKRSRNRNANRGELAMIDEQSYLSNESGSAAAASGRLDPSFYPPTMQNLKPDPTMFSVAGGIRIPRPTSSSTSGPDPSVYHDTSDKPDPEDNDLLLLTYGDDPSVGGRSRATKGSYRGMEDPPLKPKRDPTMYVESNGDDPSMAYNQYGRDDPSMAYNQYNRDDPSMAYNQYNRDDPSMAYNQHNRDDPSMAYNQHNRDDPSVLGGASILGGMSFVPQGGGATGAGAGRAAGGRDDPSIMSRQSRRSEKSNRDDPSIRYERHNAAQPDGDVMRQKSMYMGGMDDIDGDSSGRSRSRRGGGGGIGGTGGNGGSYVGQQASYTRKPSEMSGLSGQSGRSADPYARDAAAATAAASAAARAGRSARDVSNYSVGVSTYYDDESFRTQEPEESMDGSYRSRESGRSGQSGGGRSERSKKSKKSQRSKRQ